jgi:hypothetical protein
MFSRVGKGHRNGNAALVAVLMASATPAAWAQTAQPPRQAVLAADCRTAEASPLDPLKSSGDVARTDRATLEATARARYLSGDLAGALEAWNQLAEPRIRCLNVDGLVRTDRRIVIDYLDRQEGEILTAEALARIDRRLDELTFASRTGVRFDPAPDGSSTVTPIVQERSMLPKGMGGWGEVAVRAAFRQELRVRLVSPTGHGEVWTPALRLQRNRPRARLQYSMPAPGVLPGLLSAVASAERQAYDYSTLGGEYLETRYRAGAALADWMTSWLRWEGGAAYDQIAGVPRLAFEGSLNARALGDRLGLIGSAGYWMSGRGDQPFALRELMATARSTSIRDVAVLTAQVGVTDVSESAPLALWPAASSSQARGARLRAHPLRTAGVITGEVFGRRMFFASTEYEHPFHTPVGTIGVAAFVDAAQAWRRLDGSASVFHVDVGTGLRMTAFGSSSIRADIGYGLRDQRVRLSVGYQQPWGRRRR